ncbi:MAG: hypothetical protein HWD62_18880 [Cyclobacteriaceae bacterium]|nr:MAG: hypothetical protein HWD62_18880 [Cyclobacteriaceae bacterium]
MSTKRQIVGSSGIYFITITCYEWLPLFELTNGYDIVYKWFDYLKQQGHFITGYAPPLPVFFTGNFVACLLVKNNNRGEGFMNQGEHAFYFISQRSLPFRGLRVKPNQFCNLCM